MLKFIALSCFIALAYAAAVSEDAVPRKLTAKPANDVVTILRSEAVQEEDGSYNFLYEGADGSSRQEKGVVVDDGNDQSHLVVSGSYKYIDATGAEILVSYTADENGFVPVGTNILPSISAAAKAAVAHSELESKKATKKN